MAKPGFAWIWEKGWEPLLSPLSAAIHSCHSWVLKCSAPTAICSVALMSAPGSEPCPCEGVCPQVGSSLAAGVRTGLESTN